MIAHMKGNKDPQEEKTGLNNARAPRGLSHKNTVLKAEMDELTRAREDIKKAKDSAMQSWLDSKPLLYDLEKVRMLDVTQMDALLCNDSGFSSST